MKWELTEPSFGSMIRVRTGSIYHYGIFVSDEEIIQFGLSPSLQTNIKPCDVAVCSSDIDTFLCGGFLEVGVPEKQDLKKLRSPEATVSTARSRIGEKNYSIIYNNCEHFVYECSMGIKYCSQTDNVRELFRQFPIVDVYTSMIVPLSKATSFSNKAIDNDVSSSANEMDKAQKLSAWRLLEHALERSFGKKLKKCSFEKQENGAWKCDACELDILYTESFAAVAVSRKPIKISVGKSDGYDWSADTVINGNTYTVYVKTDTPDKIRFYSDVKLKY